MANLVAVDTSVVVDGFRGDQRAAGYLKPLERRGLLAIHPIAFLEVLRGAGNASEPAGLQQALSLARLMRVRGDDLPRCIELFTRHHLSHGIGWPDCLIAATCIRLGLPLATLNDKHFRPIRGLKVIRPY